MKIITGMHRSGTSMVAGLLYKLGANFGDDSELLAADQYNKNGYYENREIFILNDAILLGDWAPSRAFWEAAPEERSISLRAIMWLARLRYGTYLFRTDGIRQRAAKKSEDIRAMQARYGGIYVKDPRFSLVIKDWEQIVPIEKVLYCFRHPYEVAQSLVRRRNGNEAMAYKSWHLHVKSFLHQAEGLPIIFVNYNNFFQDETQAGEIKRLYNFLEWEFSEQNVTDLANSAIKRGLRNHHHTTEGLPADVEQIYEKLLSLHPHYPTLKPFDLNL